MPWMYLTDFYSKSAGSGEATRSLKRDLQAIGRPIILCCEPILGSDPRSLTPRTAGLTADERTASLAHYYRSRFNMLFEIPVCCTLRTDLTGRGRHWSEPDRRFMVSLAPLESSPLRHSTTPSMSATSDSSRDWSAHPFLQQKHLLA